MTPDEERDIRDRWRALELHIKTHSDASRGVRLYVQHVRILLDEIDRVRSEITREPSTPETPDATDRK